MAPKVKSLGLASCSHPFQRPVQPQRSSLRQSQLHLTAIPFLISKPERFYTHSACSSSPSATHCGDFGRVPFALIEEHPFTLHLMNYGSGILSPHAALKILKRLTDRGRTILN